MRTIPIVALFCCSLLFATASVQEPSAEQRQIEKRLQKLLSPIQRLEWEAERLATMRSPWNGHGTWMSFNTIMRFGGENELGLTEEQKQRFSFHYTDDGIRYTKEGMEANWFVEMDQNPTLEYTQAMEAMKTAYSRHSDDPWLERATEEQKNVLREAFTGDWNLFFAAQHKEILEILTPEQMLQLRKLEMQLMPAIGIPFPSMFDPLDLTEEQKKEMDKITEEMKAEFDKLILEVAIDGAEQMSSQYELLRGKSFASEEEFQKASEKAREAANVPSEARRKKFLDHLERGTKFVTLLQTRLMDVLTDEQLDKMQKILDETPMFAKKVIAGIKMQRAIQQLSPTYVPGPDSWRPGDPLPEKFKQERQQQRSRFPRGESTE